MILEKIDQDLLALAKQSDNDLKDIYAQVDELCLVNSNKVLSAFIENKFLIVILPILMVMVTMMKEEIN